MHYRTKDGGARELHDGVGRHVGVGHGLEAALKDAGEPLLAACERSNALRESSIGYSEFISTQGAEAWYCRDGAPAAGHWSANRTDHDVDRRSAERAHREQASEAAADDEHTRTVGTL
jgi:hypothetical protein